MLFGSYWPHPAGWAERSEAQQSIVYVASSVGLRASAQRPILGQAPSHRYLPFNTDDGHDEGNDQAVGDGLATFTDQELTERTVGIDRGVIIPACASDCRDFGLSPAQQARLASKALGKVRWQRRMARRVKGSGGWPKAKRRVSAHGRCARNVRKDYAHQTSHALVTDPKTLLIVFEVLQIQNMTRKPRPQQDAQGRCRPNRAAAKAGLNKAILASAWGHTDNADHNAANVIAAHGLAMIWSGAYRPKARKNTLRLGKKVGPERSEPGQNALTPVKTLISRRDGNIAAQGSLKQPPPTARRA